MNKIITSIIGAVAVLALIISIGNSVGGNQSVSTKGITNYDSIVVDKLGVGTTTTTAAEAVVSGTGTTTLMLTGTKGCIQIINTAGTVSAIYLVGTTVTVSASACK